MHAAFLADICDHPDDDGPRLIFADWLEERGDPRGEFIRVQCELARLPPDHPRWPALHAREGALLQYHGLAWRQELPPMVGIRWEPFVRGFAAVAELEGADGLRHLKYAFAAPTPLRGLQCRRFTPTAVAALAAVPEAARLEVLDLRGSVVGHAGAAALAASPHLAGLRRLDLGDGGIGLAGAAALANATGLTQLAELDLTGNHLGPPGAEVLAAGPGLPALERLALADNLLGDDGLVRLAAWPGRWGRLTDLDLARNQLGAAGLRRLTARPLSLRGLDLGFNRLGAEGARALAGANALACATLDLRYNQLGNAGAQALAAGAWPGLRTLVLQNNGVTDVGARYLLASRALADLAFLSLRSNPLSRAGVAALRDRFGDRVQV
jgi:uncharacterized protein (TIGR02996 family)